MALEEKFTRSRATYDVTRVESETHAAKQRVVKETVPVLDDTEGEEGATRDREAFDDNVNVNPPDTESSRTPETRQPVNFIDMEGRSNDRRIENIDVIAPDHVPCLPVSGSDLPVEDASNDIGKQGVGRSPYTLQRPSTEDSAGEGRRVPRAPSHQAKNIRKSTISPSNRAPSSNRPSPLAQVQMVLNTSGASWNLRRSAEDDKLHDQLRSTKKPRLENDSKRTPAAGASAKQKITNFALPGSQLAPIESTDTPESGEEEDLAAQHHHFDVDNSGSSIVPGILAINSSCHPSDQEPSNNTTMKGPSEMDVEMAESPVGHQDVPIDEPTQDIDVETSGAQSTGTSVDEESSAPPSLPTEVVRTFDGGDIAMNIDLDTLEDSWRRMQTEFASMRRTPSEQPTEAETTETIKHAGSLNVEEDQKASETLSRVLEKSDFAEMDAIGQFNLGFIVSRRKNARGSGDLGRLMDDLFIIDQHAADEKYNFEKLQQTTKLNSQKLIRFVGRGTY